MTARGKRILAALVFAGAFAAGWMAQGWRAGTALAQLEQQHTQVLVAQHAQALVDYQRMEATKNEAINAAQQRAAQNRAAADRAAAAAGSLQRDIASVPDRITAATRAAVNAYAATAGELLGACTAEYQWLAEQADGHAADARLMREAWPTARQNKLVTGSHHL
ncbi:hypothetical protein [Comamonas sp. GB3 AK4-5]|uniref:hypothetical protein n=1 Tax=Comamonas sp. GB3 AK4-5 TaxID=3231487 RepID=UPI00351DF2D9